MWRFWSFCSPAAQTGAGSTTMGTGFLSLPVHVMKDTTVVLCCSWTMLWLCFISDLHVTAFYFSHLGLQTPTVCPQSLCAKEWNLVFQRVPLYYICTYIQQYKAVGFDLQRCIKYDSCILNGSCEPASGSSVDIVNKWPPAAILWIKKGQVSIT